MRVVFFSCPGNILHDKPTVFWNKLYIMLIFYGVHLRNLSQRKGFKVYFRFQRKGFNFFFSFSIKISRFILSFMKQKRKKKFVSL